jgi:hypothetical protein
MLGSFLKRRSGLQAPAEFRDLLRAECPRRKLFERAEGNAIGLAQGAIDGAGFGHAHLGIVENQRRDIAGMSVAVADEATALGGLEYGSFKDPEVLFLAAQGKHRFCHNPVTTLTQRETQQIPVSNIAGPWTGVSYGTSWAGSQGSGMGWLHR